MAFGLEQPGVDVELFKIEWLLFPGEEGDAWLRASRSNCAVCGLSVVPYANRFPVGDDSVVSPHLYLDTLPVPPMFRVGGVHFVTESLQRKIERLFPGAFTFEKTGVEWENEPRVSEDIYWAKSSGRAIVRPLYWRLGKPCPSCKHRQQERIEPRRWAGKYEVLHDSWSGSAIYYVEENGAPEFADGSFKRFLEHELASYPESVVSFDEVRIVVDE